MLIVSVMMSLMYEEIAPLPCVDKLAFDTQKQAEAAALTADYQRGITLKTYQCRHCGLWHLSSAS
ncbi:MAG: hypothetical protein QFB86_02750 [Patescibacteria group bacterium]|nr:hypothetical protein [Patescibacteria group bacterium]